MMKNYYFYDINMLLNEYFVFMGDYLWFYVLYYTYFYFVRACNV